MVLIDVDELLVLVTNVDLTDLKSGTVRVTLENTLPVLILSLGKRLRFILRVGDSSSITKNGVKPLTCSI
jgi:hypothetical protein